MNVETMKTLLLVTGIEVVVVFALISLFLIWKNVKSKKADQKAVQTLVKNVQKNDQGRRESLLKVFGECYDMEENELESAVDGFLNRERAFYKTLISVYVSRDAGEFAKLSTSLEEMVKPYSDLALSVDLSDDGGNLESLQQKNKDLNKELDESKKVMDELLLEYSASFDKEGKGTSPEAIMETPDESDEKDVTSFEQSEKMDMEGTTELTVDISEVEEMLLESEDDLVDNEVVAEPEDDLVVEEVAAESEDDLVVEEVAAESEDDLVVEEVMSESEGALVVEDTSNDEDIDRLVEEATEGDGREGGLETEDMKQQDSEISLDEVNQELESDVMEEEV